MIQQLPITILNKRTQLPEKPASISLLGKYVRLEPLVIERDAQRLFEISNGSALQLGERLVDSYDADELVWRYIFDGPFKNIFSLLPPNSFSDPSKFGIKKKA